MNQHQTGLALASVLALAISSPSFAADMPVKAPAPAPAPIVYNWDGLYVGGEAGWRGNTDDWTTNCVQLGGPFTCGSALNALVFPGAPDSTASNKFSTSGFRGGVYAGGMFQVKSAPSWVLGAEFEYGFARQNATVAGLLGCSTAACTGGVLTPFNLSGDSTTVKMGNDLSIRLRTGYLVLPTVLAYLTGGFAGQNVSGTMSCNGATSPACSFGTLSSTTKAFLTGWTAGGGLEWQVLPHWLLRAEYRYSDYGNWNPSFLVGSGVVELFANVHVKTQIATAGLAYQFPVSAMH